MTQGSLGTCRALCFWQLPAGEAVCPLRAVLAAGEGRALKTLPLGGEKNLLWL